MIADDAALPDGRLQVRRRQVRNLRGGQGTADHRKAGPGQVHLFQEGPVRGDEFGGRILSSVAGSSPLAASSSQQACIWGVPEATEMK